jgi:Sec-independent protein translocase protein TatA
MLDLSVTKMALIGVVGLVVLGREQLPTRVLILTQLKRSWANADEHGRMAVQA